jgi:hypothetical protein
MGVYMLANQLPLLCLGDLEQPLESGAKLPATCEWLQRFAEVRKETGEAQSRRLVLAVIAFSDPNDLLSYPIPMAVRGFEDMRLVNVDLHVAKWSFLGVFTNPIQAHEGYWTDPAVVHLIACGHGVDASC